ncbi:DUF447 family protein [Thermococcus atlanticus]
MIEYFEEGRVYEVVLVTLSNAATVGVSRKGGVLAFRLFGGKSSEEIKKHPFVSVQITNDVELLVKLALNMKANLEFGEFGMWRHIRGLPGIFGRVEFRERVWRDEFGESKILECIMTPEGELEGNLPLRPLSRADFALLEMAVHFTRLPLAIKTGNGKLINRLRSKIEEYYGLYRHLGGKNELAEFMMARMRELLHGAVL